MNKKNLKGAELAVVEATSGKWKKPLTAHEKAQVIAEEKIAENKKKLAADEAAFLDSLKRAASLPGEETAAPIQSTTRQQWINEAQGAQLAYGQQQAALDRLAEDNQRMMDQITFFASLGAYANYGSLPFPEAQKNATQLAMEAADKALWSAKRLSWAQKLAQLARGSKP